MSAETTAELVRIRSNVTVEARDIGDAYSRALLVLVGDAPRDDQTQRLDTNLERLVHELLVRAAKISHYNLNALGWRTTCASIYQLYEGTGKLDEIVRIVLTNVAKGYKS